MKKYKLKLKTHVIMVAKTYPMDHKRAGDFTDFRYKILNGSKIHTIRQNYPYWKKRIDEVNNGTAIISLRNWEDKPYNSKQVEFKQLKKGEVSIQKLTIDINLGYFIDDYDSDITTVDLANNDGLPIDDFSDWFKGAKANDDLAIIQFTNFKY